MKEQLVSAETANLAKEVGFDVRCVYGYTPEAELVQASYLNKKIRDGVALFDNSNNKKEHCSAPTQSLLSKWVREQLEIHIDITYDFDVGYRCWLKTRENVYPVKIKEDKLFFSTYEKAMEAGLQKALSIIE